LTSFFLFFKDKPLFGQLETLTHPHTLLLKHGCSSFDPSWRGALHPT